MSSVEHSYRNMHKVCIFEYGAGGYCQHI